MSITLTLAHSPDPDDVFMWWPITGMIDPRDHARVVRPPVLDTGRYSFLALPEDIAVLNKRAIEVGDLAITAISIFAWAQCADRYALTSCGGSFGDGYGPKIVVRAGGVTEGVSGTADEARVTIERLLHAREGRLAIPGRTTTACALMCMLLGWDRARLDTELARGRVIELPFDEILAAVSSGAVSAGLLIHQAQLTFPDLGLVKLVDLGEYWRAWTGMPLPLGGNAIKRDLGNDLDVSRESLKEITAILDRSIRHALVQRDDGIAYALGFARDLDATSADRYIKMYVSSLTVDAGSVGVEAIRRMLCESHARGLCAGPPRGMESWNDVELVKPA